MSVGRGLPDRPSANLDMYTAHARDELQGPPDLDLNDLEISYVIYFSSVSEEVSPYISCHVKAVHI